MTAAQSRQKSYADKKRKPFEFSEGEHVFLKVTPTTGVGRAIKAKKLNPKFIGSYQILKRIGPVAYQIALPPFLSNLHDVFHVSQLRKYIHDPSHVLVSEAVQAKKLNPKFIGSYQILKRIGPVAYQIALPPFLSNLHDVFHVSQLRKYIHDPSHVLESEAVQVKENLTFEKQPVSVADKKVKQLRGKSINLVKVIWDEITNEATWELEERMKDQYPYLF
uniref:Tf2-1-like SH3-like domain-containing protein n=1 Tax=Cajanus cajan TaxID=3821 RepID=A0A151QU17_CAJCA|nr:hypothetical protein KK1_045288 [Cajanus cajan]